MSGADRVSSGLGVDDGGPAFPPPIAAAPNGEQLSSGSFGLPSGMTLRDYFAARAMVRLTGADPDGVHSADTLAMLSYRLADAMLKARNA